MRFSSLPTAFIISPDIFKLSVISLSESEQLHEQANITFKTIRSRVLRARLEVKHCLAEAQLPNNPETGSLDGEISGDGTLSDDKDRSIV